MRRLLTVVVLAALAGSCGGDDKRQYSQNDLQMLTAFSAKAYCSCLFVMELDEAACVGWAKQSPPLARYEVDREKKEVRASALVLWAARARWVDARAGCALVE